MKTQDEISTELLSLSSMLPPSKSVANPLEVPDGYFETFLRTLPIMLETRPPSDLDLGTSEHTATYRLPDNYWATLPTQILDLVREQESIDNGLLPNALTEATKSSPLQVPQGYFEGFASQLSKAIAHKGQQGAGIEERAPALDFDIALLETARTKELSKGADHPMPQTKALPHPATQSMKWAKWAAVASVVFILGLGGTFFLSSPLDQQQAKGMDMSNALSHIPKAHIQEWLSRHIDEEDMGHLDLTANDIHSLYAQASLQQFSDEDIKRFLDVEF